MVFQRLVRYSTVYNASENVKSSIVDSVAGYTAWTPTYVSLRDLEMFEVAYLGGVPNIST